MTNVAIENGPFIVDFPSYKMVIFNSYVKLPEGMQITRKKHRKIYGEHVKIECVSED